MLTIAKLFGKSPFAPIQNHMDRVASCIGQLPLLFKELSEQDDASLQRLSKQISKLEHEADLTKNDIPNHLPKSLFLPVDRGALLEILALQDSLADQAQKIAISSCLFPLVIIEEMQEDFALFCQKNIDALWLSRQVIKELDELLECSFGGIEAEKVKGMVEQIAFLKYEADQLEYKLTRTIYQEGSRLSQSAFHLWLTLIHDIAVLAHLAEKLGNRVRTLLELH
jgi:predicted phosphate transport protein (TIGR00153 family)